MAQLEKDMLTRRQHNGILCDDPKVADRRKIQILRAQLENARQARREVSQQLRAMTRGEPPR